MLEIKHVIMLAIPLVLFVSIPLDSLITRIVEHFKKGE